MFRPLFGKTFSSISSSVAVLMLCGFFCAGLTSLAHTQVVAWGDNSYGQTNVPPDLTNVVAIASSSSFNLALKSDGTVVAWGDNSLGQTNVPADLTNAVAITCSGVGVCLALKGDGTVEGWGADWDGQADGRGLSNVVAVSAGYHQGLALLSDGTVVQWGGTWSAPLSDETNDVRAIAAEGYSDADNFVLLYSDGTVTEFGTFFPDYAPVPSDLSNAVAITTSPTHALALRSDGTVEEWGYYTDVVPDGLSNVVAIADETALKSDGTIVQWNGNTPPAGLSNVVAITPSLALIGTGLPVTHAVMNNLTRGPNEFSLTLPTQNGRVFGVEYKNSLTDSNWTFLPLVAGTGTNLVLTDTDAISSQRFYRVRRW